MILLIIFAFIAGVVTVLSPCILPLLPIILSSSTTEPDKQRPLGVVIGFVASFTFFTLFLSSIVKATHIPAESLRVLSILILAVLGISLLIPQVQTEVEIVFGRLANLIPSQQKRTGFVGGLVVGLSLGLLWTPCVGPILASVISLALAGTVSTQAFVITTAYAIGTAIPMFIIMLVGSTALQRVPWLVRNTSKIQKAFGVLMILTSLAIFFNLDRRFQTAILNAFPNYGVGLTTFEENEGIKKELQKITQKPMDKSMLGKPMSELARPTAPELIPGGEWFNSPPLTLASLRGKVVLVDFWTYTCINCQRTLPYLRDWWESYKNQGLVIIGVHAPEFEFEKNSKNVSKAIADFDLKYPIVQDNEFATWRAYENQYWPAKYLIDKDGYVRYTHFGEGNYDETERMIQKLLKEAGSAVTDQISNKQYDNDARTPELYLGYDRMRYLSSPEDVVQDNEAHYSVPSKLTNNSFALEGTWIVTPEYSSPSKGSTLHLNFDAKKVFLVARPVNGSVTMKVVMGEGIPSQTITVDSDSLYQLVDLPESGRHTLIIEFPEGNVEVFAFTFG